jgi:Nucleotidyl transferase AbiEii toxin, Type IV TA system
VAEKLHAYTLPCPRENSRVKDLPDLALLAATGEFASSTLHRAIEATFAFRNTHPIPDTLPAPPSSWTAAYAKLADGDRLPWRDLDLMSAAARTFLDPVLGRTAGAWDPESWSWKAPQQELPASRRLRR